MNMPLATRVNVNPDSARALAARSPKPVNSSAAVSLALVTSGHCLDFDQPLIFNLPYRCIPRILAWNKPPCYLRLICSRNEVNLRLCRGPLAGQGRDDGVNLVSFEGLCDFLNIVIINNHELKSTRRSRRGSLLPQSAQEFRVDD